MRTGTRTNMQYVKNIDTRTATAADADIECESSKTKTHTCESCERWHKMLNVWNLLLMCTCSFPFSFIFCINFFLLSNNILYGKKQIPSLSSVCSRFCKEKHTQNRQINYGEKRRKFVRIKINMGGSCGGECIHQVWDGGRIPNQILFHMHGILVLERSFMNLAVRKTFFSRRFFSLSL